MYAAVLFEVSAVGRPFPGLETSWLNFKCLTGRLTGTVKSTGV